MSCIPDEPAAREQVSTVFHRLQQVCTYEHSSLDTAEATAQVVEAALAVLPPVAETC